MTQGTLHAQPKLPPANPHETLETQEAVSGDDFPTPKYLAVLFAARSYKNQLDLAEPPLSRSQGHKVFWGVGQTTLRCLQVGHEDFNDFRDGDGERLLRALLDYEDSTFKPLQMYRSPEPGCEDVRDSDGARFFVGWSKLWKANALGNAWDQGA